MKNIHIQRLTLENFKCHGHLELEFCPASALPAPSPHEECCSASIYGDNATGKTSVYDALTWLLFGKDSHGNGEKNIDIKPLGPDGSVRDHEALTSVEAVLWVEEDQPDPKGRIRTVKLKRTLREIWTSRRGSSEPVFDGNTSEYFLDDVPMKKIEFGRRVAEIVEEDVFRLLTSVSCFAQDLEWKQRRSILHALSGVDAVNDRMLLGQEDRFASLLEALQGRSVDDLGRVLAVRRKGLIGVKDETPARINECELAVASLSAIDFDAAQRQLDGLLQKKEALLRESNKIRSNSALGDLENRLARISLDRRQLQMENEAHRQKQAAALPDPEALAREADRQSRAAERLILDLQTLAQMEKTYEEKLEERRQAWILCSAARFQGGTCPSCGQRLPMEQLKQATARHEEEKQKKLEAIEQIANDYQERLTAVRKEILEKEKERKCAEDEADRLRASLQGAAKAREKILDLPDYLERMHALEAAEADLQQQMRAAEGDSAQRLRELDREIYRLDDEIGIARNTLGKRWLLDHNSQRIEELRRQARETAAELEKTEQLLYLIDDFVRYKTGFIEDSVNGCFRLARFRLFREQANGGVEARCDVVFDGVPYASLNSGAKINVGIDIINTLSRWYGVRVPLFVDNAESVTRLEETESQVIRLVVREQDKRLRVVLDDDAARYCRTGKEVVA